jgi:hypothetical protein
LNIRGDRRSAAAQILVTALLRSVKRLAFFSSAKGGAPANLFQTSARRLADHEAAASPSCASVAKVVPLAPASLMAASLSGCTAKLFSVSMLYVGMWCSLVRSGSSLRTTIHHSALGDHASFSCLIRE